MPSQLSDNDAPSRTAPTHAIQRIHVICMQHLDVAWLWPRVPDGEDLMRQCFERAVTLIEAYPDEAFVFSRSTAWSFHLIEQQCPALFDRVKEYVRQGRIALCGGQWVEPDHMIPGGEALVRQATLAQWYFLDRFGKTARVCWAMDNFAHAGSLPQILRNAGMDGYYLSRCLPLDEEGRPRLQFIWKGLDGSELAAFKLQNMTELDENTVRQIVAEREPDGLPALLVKANDMYSDRRITMQERWLPQPGLIAANPALPDCRWSSPDDIVEDMQSYRDRLPVVDGELGFEYTGTYTTDGPYKRKHRRLETLLSNAEKACCWALSHGFPYPTAQLKQAWSDLCLNQFHDLICSTSFGEVLEEADRLNTEIEHRARWALDQSLAFLCDRLHAEQDDQEPSGDALAVFSFPSFDQTVPVRLPASDSHDGSYVDASGLPVPAQAIIDPDGTRADLILHEHNGIESRIYRRRSGHTPVAGPPIARDDVLENDFVRVDIDPHTGELTGLFDKRQAMEYVPDNCRGNRLEFLGEANLSPHPAWCTMEPWWIMYTGEQFAPAGTVEVRRRDIGPLRGSFRVTRTLTLHPDMPATVIVQDIALYRHSPVLHFETRGEWHAERIMLKARFDLPFTASRVDADAPYGVAERRLPQHLDNNVSRTIGIGEEWKADRDPPPEPDRSMQTWLDVSDGSRGLLVLNNGKYGYDADEHQVGISLMRAPNMRPWQNDILGLGPFEFSYAVMPHAGDWRTVNAPRHGHAFNTPPEVRPVRPGVHDLAGAPWWHLRGQASEPVTRQFLTLHDDGVEVTAIKQAEDGNGLILRLVECLGAARQVTIDMGQSIESARECDLLERPLGTADAPLTPAAGQLVVRMSGHEIKTVRVQFAKKGGIVQPPE